MLFTRAAERQRREDAASLERFTLAVNNGLAISSSKDARRAFERGRAARDVATAPAQSLAEYRATKARLAARFPGNVTVH